MTLMDFFVEHMERDHNGKNGPAGLWYGPQSPRKLRVGKVIFLVRLEVKLGSIFWL